MERKPLKITAAIFVRSLAIAILIMMGQSSLAADSIGDGCENGTGLVILVSQNGLYLDRAAHRGSITKSVMGSLLASALTGGTVLIGMYDHSEPETIVDVSQQYTDKTGPLFISHQLLGAFSEAKSGWKSEVHLLGAFTQGGDVDAILAQTNCARVIVADTAYNLVESRTGIQLSMVTQVISIPNGSVSQKRTIAAVEYRSDAVRYALPQSAQKIAAALNDFMAEHSSTIEDGLRKATEDLSHMVAYKLSLTGSAHETRAIIGKRHSNLDCDDCQKSDWLIVDSPDRAWLEPADHPDALRSLPWRTAE